MSRHPINLVHAEVLSPYARSLIHGGAPTDRIFESCGIPLEAVSTSNSVITMQQAYQLMDKASRYAGEKCFGSKVGMDLKLYELGALGHAVRQAPSLNDAGSVVMRAIQSSEPGSQCWLERNEQESWFCYQPVERFTLGGAQAELFDLECLLQFIRLAAGADWLPKRVRVNCTTASMLAHTQHFAEAQVTYDRRMTAIAFPNKLLTKPMLDCSTTESRISNNEALSSADPVLSVSDAISAILNSLFEYDAIPTLEVMADRLRMNSRTLQRLLANEGASYRILTERVIYRRATYLLRESKLAIKDVAAELGYGSPSSFTRTFKRVAGITPCVYRNLHFQA
jgi:AraC-like DNA-binding protein